MFIAAKLLAFVTQPLAWVMLLLVLGLTLQRWRRTASGLRWAALLVLVAQGWQPLPDLLIRQLEARHPPISDTADLSRYAGVVVLGGALEPGYMWTDHGQPALNGAAERMTAPLPLLQRYPQMKLLFTGGEGALMSTGLSEAERAKIFYRSMNVPSQRLLFESASRTTYENAVLSAALSGVDKARPWLLVTTASHMPRSLATFEKAGWNVTPYPVDYHTGKEFRWSGYSLLGGANSWQLALHEYAGLLTYWLSGRL